MRRVGMWMAALVMAVGIAACAETPKQRANRIEPMLAAAGFRMRPATTPEQADDLKSRTPLKVRYTLKDDHPRYWFADPVVCNCLYVGNEADYQRYEALRIQQRTAQEEQQAAAMNQDAVMQEQMDFGMWPMW
jgi:hypothetical protein